ncbi:MAG TPA: hypothetical protein ENJ60_01170 [Aeromonadales bacterium]|nr:hypothetical protein [Aeromonadales bacterium]
MLIRQCQSPQDEVEALNADVMRFMAILGLCLMLIFAAMEGVRVSSMETLNKTQEQVLLKRQSELEQKIRELIQTKRTLVATLRVVQQKAEQSKQHLQEQYDIKKNQADQLLLQLAQLKTSQIKKTAIKQALRIKRTVKPLKQKNSSKPQKKGYVLRFSNDEALIQLVKQQQIQLILTKQGVPFQVRHNRTISKHPLKGKHKMYALNNHTVPQIYKITFSSNMTDQWGVILPPKITTSLQRIMQQHSSGELEINALGNVSIK